MLQPWLLPARFFLVNRSTTIRVRFGKRVRSSALRPSRRKRDQKTFSPGPCSFNTKELWFRQKRQVQPVFDSRHGRITANCLRAALVKFWRTAASNQSIGLLVQPLCWLTAALEIISSSSPVPGTFVRHHNPFRWPSRATRPWTACTPALWSRSLCWSLPPYGRTTDGSAHHSAGQS